MLYVSKSCSPPDSNPNSGIVDSVQTLCIKIDWCEEESITWKHYTKMAGHGVHNYEYFTLLHPWSRPNIHMIGCISTVQNKFCQLLRWWTIFDDTLDLFGSARGRSKPWSIIRYYRNIRFQGMGSWKQNISVWNEDQGQCHQLADITPSISHADPSSFSLITSISTGRAFRSVQYAAWLHWNLALGRMSLASTIHVLCGNHSEPTTLWIQRNLGRSLLSMSGRWKLSLRWIDDCERTTTSNLYPQDTRLLHSCSTSTPLDQNALRPSPTSPEAPWSAGLDTPSCGTIFWSMTPLLDGIMISYWRHLVLFHLSYYLRILLQIHQRLIPRVRARTYPN